MYLGDFGFGSTVFFKFTTVGSSGAVSALSSGGVTAYRDGSTVQDTTGITLTASFDTVTGLNHVQIDMSTAGFYSSAGSYVAIISSGAASEDLTGYVLAHWSLLDRSPLTSTAGLETLSTLGIETLSTVGLETLSTAGLETLSTLGIETLSTLGIETLSTAGLETISSGLVAGSVWNATRASHTVAGTFGEITSTSTAAPDLWVSGPFSIHSTAGLETLSTAGIETLSTVGLETLSTVGIETLSTAGLETISSALVAGSLWNATRASFTAAGSFGQLVSTSTAAPSIWANTAAAGGGSSDVNVVQWGGSTVEGVPLDSTAGLETLSTLGIETLSTAGLETISSGLVADTVWDEILTGATHNIPTSAGRRLREVEAAFVIHASTGFGGAATINTVILDGTASTRDDFYNHTRIIVVDGTGIEQERIVVNYIGATKTAKIAPPWIVTPSSTDSFEIGPGLSHAETGWATNKVGIVQTAGASTTVKLDSEGSTVDDYYNSDIIKIDSDGSTGAEGQSRVIIDYDGSSKIVFVDTAFSQAPTTAAEYIIEDGLSSPSTTSIITSVASIGSLSTAAAIEVNAEVVDALSVDTYGEPVGVPALSASIADKLGHIYMPLRNKITVSSSAKVIHNNAGATLWGKNLSQDSTSSTGVYTEAQASTST